MEEYKTHINMVVNDINKQQRVYYNNEITTMKRLVQTDDLRTDDGRPVPCIN